MLPNSLFYKIKQNIEIFTFIAFILLVVAMPFPWHFAQPFYILWMILWFLEGRWLERGYFHITKSHIPVILMCVFVIWETISLLWTQDMHIGLNDFYQHLPIFLIFLMTVFGVNKHFDAIKIKIAFVIGCLLSILCYSLVIYQNIQSNTLYSFPPFWLDSSFWTLFGDGPVGFIKHRNFFCLVLLATLSFSFDIYRHFKKQYSPLIVGGIMAFVDIIILSVIVLTGSRMSIFILPVLCLISFLFNYRGKNKTTIILGILFSCTVLLLLGFKYNQRLIIVKEDIKKIQRQETNISENTKEPRLQIFSCILRHRNEYPFHGYGLGASKKILQRFFANDGLTFCLEQGFHTHNSYFKTWMEQGPLALIFMIFILISAPFFYSGSARKYAICVCIIFGLNMLADNELNKIDAMHVLFSLMILIHLEQQRTNSLPPAHQ